MADLSPFSVAENKELLISLLSQKQSEQVFPLSLAQRRLWFLDHLNPGNPAYNVPFALHLRGNLDPRALQMGVRELVQRHEILRTHFETEAGHPVQVVPPNLPIEITLIDLTEISDSDRYAEAHRIATEDVGFSFNLAASPLVRLKLIRLAAEENILLCVMHHIVCDGWSLGILTRELSALYDQYSGGPRASLSALPIHYGDYAKWQQEWIADNPFIGQLQYWKRKLAGAPTFLPLPVDNVRPAEQTYDGASQVLSIPGQLVHHLAEFGRTRRATLFMVVLSVFKTLLHVYTWSNDILVGVPVAGRSHLELEALVGFFVNTLVLRTDFSGDPQFSDLLLQVREVALDAFAHAELPFEKLVEELNPPRTLSYTPLVQVMFSTVKAEEVPKFGSVSAVPYILNTPKSLFDLSLEFIEDVDDRWWLRVEYATALFQSQRMTRMLDHCLTLLGAVAGQPELRISALASLLETGDLAQTKIDHQQDRSAIPHRKVPDSRFEVSIGPRDALEQTLIRIWERVLGISGIGIYDDFFDLGGHSLLAAHLVSETGKAVGCSIPLSALFRASTIESFAQVIRRHTAWSPDPLLMEINAGSRGFPLFAIVQSGVDALGYALLARCMGVAQPFYKLQASAPFCPIVPFSIEELQTIAREYIAAMRAIQPNGPYFLMGMCNGAHIAEQMVIELEALGHEVAFLVIIDTFVLQFSEIRWLARLEAFRVGRRDIFRLPLAAQAWHYKQTILNRGRRLFRREPKPADPWTAAVWPEKEFQPRRFRAPVILFKRPKQPYFKIKEPGMGWVARTSSGVTICTVNVAAHEAMLREPAVQVMAQHLAKHLNDALACMEQPKASSGSGQ
ncbi:MAG: condensation domain-containing protein [Acidobacteriaceae bacterium]